MINKLLQRQIMKHFGKLDEIPEKCISVIKVISESYEHYEKDRKMLERSIDLSSKEMIELNEHLQKEKDEQKKAADELNEIFNNIDQVVFSVDIINNRVIKMSAASEKVYGYKPEEFYNSTTLWQDVIHPDDKHIAFEQVDALAAGKQIFNQYRIIHKDKSARWIENRIIPAIGKNGKVLRIDGITSDITARRDAEEKIRRSEANLQTIFDNADTVYVLIDTELRIMSFNQPAQKFMQKELNRTLKEDTFSLDYFPETRRQAINDALLNTLKGKVTSYEVKYPQPDNSEQWYYARYFPVINNGKVLGIILTLTDITERKNIEKQTQHLVESLQSKNKDLRQFAYIVSHNLRAPISKIIGLAAVLKEVPDDESMSLLKNITAEANQLDGVVKDMNKIISVRDSVAETKEYASFQNELTHVLSDLEPEVKESKAIISPDFNPEGIITVKSYIFSIIYNLISNAIKYRSMEQPAKIYIRSREDEKFIYITVEDNGIGIDLERHGDKIFGLYKRFSSKDIPGKGIGLNIVKSQVESLGGRIEIESKIKQGSTFKVILPK
jgi:PAS domain S-box-containing protein